MGVEQYVYEQNAKRRLREETDTLEGLVVMLYQEVAELDKQVDDVYVTGDVTGLASEIGDVGYLILRICNITGLSFEQVVEMKIIRNSMKYPDHVMSNGRDLHEAVGVCKQGWEVLGGDKVWSHVYLDFLAND